jgi:hydrogenase maturation factor
MLDERLYPLGKLPAQQLSDLLARFAPTDPRVVLGPAVGRDAAVISFGDRLLVAKTDPITFATDEIGWYVVHVNANDIACMGAAPRWFLATLLLPGGQANATMVDTIFAQIAQASSEIGVEVVGGHTEITHGIDRPIVVGCMLGEVDVDGLVQPQHSQPGDAVLLSKGVAVEGTALLAREFGDSLVQLDRALVERSRRFLRDPGISVVRDAAIALRSGEVHTFHDPTEGGLATGLWELAEAAQVSLVINSSAIPIYPETSALCRALGLDALGLIASGSLLMTVAQADAARVINGLSREGIEATTIGHVVDGPAEVWLRSGPSQRPLRRFARDEIARLFD